ncbi:MAG: metallophosphoesterase [Bacteroidetes bacterium]|nr:metallophosphoesterase [Bacteroidota bacterium]
MAKRKVKVVVISDVHLGTYGCHAQELNQYLKSLDVELLIINGDFIDIWQLSKSYFPPAHTKVLQRVMKMLSNGTKVVYLTGNHDEMLRKYSGMQLGNLSIEDKLLIDIDGKKHWFFHGDVFDVSMQHSKWLAKLGGQGYDLLILINRGINHLLHSMGRERISLSKKVKDSVKGAVKFISNFEQTAAAIAIDNGYDYVICGHIHEPVMKEINSPKGTVTYLNSGDWIENLTSLEYNDGKWSLVQYDTELNNNQDEDLQDQNPSMIQLQEQINKHLITKVA